MGWNQLLTEDDFGGFANPTAAVGCAAVIGSATTAMRSDAAPTLGPLTHDLDFGGFKAANAAESSAVAHLATKNHVDSVAQSLAPKDSIRAATTGGITLSGTQTIDGVSVVAADRVFVRNWSVRSENDVHVATVRPAARLGAGGCEPSPSVPRQNPRDS